VVSHCTAAGRRQWTLIRAARSDTDGRSCHQPSAPSSTRRAIQAAAHLRQSRCRVCGGGVVCWARCDAEEDRRELLIQRDREPYRQSHGAETRDRADGRAAPGKRLRGRVTQLRPARRPPRTRATIARGERGDYMACKGAPQDRRRRAEYRHCHCHRTSAQEPVHDTTTRVVAAHQNQQAAECVDSLLDTEPRTESAELSLRHRNVLLDAFYRCRRTRPRWPSHGSSTSSPEPISAAREAIAAGITSSNHSAAGTSWVACASCGRNDPVPHAMAVRAVALTHLRHRATDRDGRGRDAVRAAPPRDVSAKPSS